MDFLTGGLIVFGFILVKEGSEFIINKVDRVINNKWYMLMETLKLDNYKIKNNYTI